MTEYEASSLNSFLEDKSLSSKRFVTVRSKREKSTNLTFDSFSAEDLTPSKRNTSVDKVTLSPQVRRSSRNNSIKMSVATDQTKRRRSSKRVRAKSVPRQLKPKSAKKRYTLHSVTVVNTEKLTTPVMTQNNLKKSLSAPRIHHMRKSRLDDDVNESLHMDDSALETPVLHEASRRSLAKKSAAKLQESLRLTSPSTDDENTGFPSPDLSAATEKSGKESIFNTPLKVQSSILSKSSTKLSDMKVSITSTPKEISRGVKRKLSSSLEGSYKKSKISMYL